MEFNKICNECKDNRNICNDACARNLYHLHLGVIIYYSIYDLNILPTILFVCYR